MKKLVLNVIAAALMTLGLGGVAMMSPAYAKDSNIKDCVGKVDCDAITGGDKKDGVFEKNDLMGTLTTIINVIVGMVGFIAVAMIVLGGISYATSQGDAAKTKKAMNTILYGVVGLVVALLAFAIVNFVLTNVFGD